MDVQAYIHKFDASTWNTANASNQTSNTVLTMTSIYMFLVAAFFITSDVQLVRQIQRYKIFMEGQYKRN